MISEGSCDTEVMMLKIQLCITEINYILKYIQIKKQLNKIVIIFHNFYCIFDQINAALVSRRDLFKKPTPNYLNGSV